MSTLAISFDHYQFTLIHGPNIPGSYAILFITSDFTPTTSHIQNCVLFLCWRNLFILSGVISPVAYWAPTDLGSSSFSIIPFCFSYCSWDSQGKNTEVVCHSLLHQQTKRIQWVWCHRVVWCHKDWMWCHIKLMWCHTYCGCDIHTMGVIWSIIWVWWHRYSGCAVRYNGYDVR